MNRFRPWRSAVIFSIAAGAAGFCANAGMRVAWEMRVAPDEDFFFVIFLRSGFFLESLRMRMFVVRWSGRWSGMWIRIRVEIEMQFDEIQFDKIEIQLLVGF